MLRTHYLQMNVRQLVKTAATVRIIVRERFYSRDNPDAKNGFMFHQMEGLARYYINICDFKGFYGFRIFACANFGGPKVEKDALRPRRRSELFSVHTRAFGELNF